MILSSSICKTNKYYRNGFGADFDQDRAEFVDLVATTFFGVCYENEDNPHTENYYPYYGKKMSMDTMDEFDAAFLTLGLDADQGQLCFLDSGINGDVNWTVEDGQLKLSYLPTGEEFYGMFYWDSTNQKRYILLYLNDYNLWLTDDTTASYVVYPDEVTDTIALTAIQNYCYAQNPDLEKFVNAEEYGVYWSIISADENEIEVLFRSYTGTNVRYYIDKATGNTHVTEFVPFISDAETPTDETLNVWDYLD